MFPVFLSTRSLPMPCAFPVVFLKSRLAGSECRYRNTESRLSTSTSPTTVFAPKLISFTGKTIGGLVDPVILIYLLVRPIGDRSRSASCHG